MADRSIIDTMTDGMVEQAITQHGWSDEYAAMMRSDAHFRGRYANLARAALRSLIDAGPTEAMVDAGLKVTCGGLDDEANRYWQAREFTAMLRAALEEADNHG